MTRSRAADVAYPARRRRGSTSARFSWPTRVVISVALLWFTWWVTKDTSKVINDGRPDGLWAFPVMVGTLLFCATILFSLWRPRRR